MKVPSCWPEQLAVPFNMALCRASSPGGWQCRKTKDNATHLPCCGLDSVRYCQAWQRMVSEPSRMQSTVSFTLVLKVLGAGNFKLKIPHNPRQVLSFTLADLPGWSWIQLCWEFAEITKIHSLMPHLHHIVQNVNVSSWMGKFIQFRLSWVGVIRIFWQLHSYLEKSTKMSANPGVLTNPILPLIQSSNFQQFSIQIARAVIVLIP